MSDKITYVLEVNDKFSKNLTKFKSELLQADKAAKNLDKTLKKLNTSLDLKNSISQLNKLSKQFNSSASFSSSNFNNASNKLKKQFKQAEDLSASIAKSSAIIARNRRGYYSKMGASISEMDWKIVGTTFGARRMGRNNFPAIGQSPLSLGGSNYLGMGNSKPLGIEYSSSKPQPVKIVGFSDSAKQSAEKFSGGYKSYGNNIFWKTPSNGGSGGKPPSGGGIMPVNDNYDGGISLKNVAKATGYYHLVNAAAQLPRALHDAAIQIENFRASLDALIKTAPGATAGVSVKSEEKWLRKTAQELGVKFDVIAPTYKDLLATGSVSPDLAKQTTRAVAGYSRLVGSTPEQMSGTMYAIQQMFTRQRLYAEEVNRQMQRMPGGKKYLGEAYVEMLKGQGKIAPNAKIIEKNIMPAFEQAMKSEAGIKTADIIPYFNKVILDKYEKDIKTKSHTLGGEEARLANELSQSATIIGEGLNPIMKQVVTALTEFISIQNQAASGELGRKGVPISPITGKPMWEEKQAQPQKIVVEFIGNVPPNMSIRPQMDQNISGRTGSTLSPIGGY